VTAGDRMKVPGPDHPITIEPTRERVRVVFNGRVDRIQEEEGEQTKGNTP
jgi:uncharacterized protein (DUF427 family)